MSFLLFSGFILYERGLEQPELFLFVAVKLSSTSKKIQFEQNEACLSSSNFPRAAAESGRQTTGTQEHSSTKQVALSS